MKKLIGAFLFLLSGLVFSVPPQKIVVFGDSLSDNGNLYDYMQGKLPSSPPYYEGRFTNGPVWVEQLAEKMFPGQGASHLLDYAFGGAGVAESAEDDVLFTLKHEIDSYLLAHKDKADPDSLFIVWIGANNYLGVPDDVNATVEEVNTGIYHGLQRLADAGASQIMIVNLPDLGRTPAARLFDAESTLTQASLAHNTRLGQMTEDLKKAYPDVQWLSLDIYSLLNACLDEPQQYGFNNVKDTCYDSLMTENASSSTPKSMLRIAAGVSPVLRSKISCEGFLFFDPVHPAAHAHTIIATEAHAMLTRAAILKPEKSS